MTPPLPLWIRQIEDDLVAEEEVDGTRWPYHQPTHRRISIDEWFVRYIASGVHELDWKARMAAMQQMAAAYWDTWAS